MSKKYFPLKDVGKACRLKWSESSIILNAGKVFGCHKGSSPDTLTPENFHNFHNLENKVRHRKQMLEGEWPDDDSCWHCRDVEVHGGLSQRQFSANVPDMYPEELDDDPTATIVTPKQIEIFFDNACNLSCLYCAPSLSSKIQFEEKKFGGPIVEDSRIDYSVQEHAYKDLLPHFIKWLDENYDELQRLQILGGETLIQPQFWKFFELVKTKANPNLEIQLTSNLIIKNSLLEDLTAQIRDCLSNRRFKDLIILASVDCWGPEHEYIRYGFNTEMFEKNLEYILDNRFITVGLHSCITSLSISSMPKLAQKYKEWSEISKIDWYVDLVSPHDHQLNPIHLDYSLFEEAITETLDILSSIKNEKAKHVIERLSGFASQIRNTPNNIDIQKKMLYYLDNIDLRRGLNWRSTFPWLDSYFKRKNISNENILEEQK